MPYTTELIALIGSVIGLLYAVALIRNVLSHSPGTQEMKQLADYIKEGANAFLKREYLTITPIAVVIALVIGLTVHPLGIVALGFVIGGALSAVAGYVSISTTVRSSSRTAEAAKKGLAKLLQWPLEVAPFLEC
jgi:Inorganic pyrophosphatase